MSLFRYDRLLLQSIVIAAYTGWTGYASLFIFRPHSCPSRSFGITLVTLAELSVFGALWIIFVIQRSPWSFYLYAAFPCYFWQQVLQAMPSIWIQFMSRPRSWVFYTKLAFRFGLVFGILQSMVVSTLKMQFHSYLSLIRLPTPTVLYGASG
jgi:phosphatidylinositol glycan class N